MQVFVYVIGWNKIKTCGEDPAAQTSKYFQLKCVAQYMVEMEVKWQRMYLSFVLRNK